MGATRASQQTFASAYPPPSNYGQHLAGTGAPPTYGSPASVNPNPQWPPPPSAPPPIDPWGRTSVPPTNPSTAPYNPNQYGPMPGSQYQQAPPLPHRLQDQQQLFGLAPAQGAAPQQPPQLPPRPMSIPPKPPSVVTQSSAGYQPQAQVQTNQQGWQQRPPPSNLPPGSTYSQYGQDGRQSVPPPLQAVQDLPPPAPPKNYGDSYPAGPPAGPPPGFPSGFLPGPPQGPPSGPPAPPVYQHHSQDHDQAPHGIPSVYGTGPETPTAARPNGQYPAQGPQVPPKPYQQAEPAISTQQPVGMHPYQHQQQQSLGQPQSFIGSSYHQQLPAQQQQVPSGVFHQPNARLPSPQQNMSNLAQQQQVAPYGNLDAQTEGVNLYGSQASGVHSVPASQPQQAVAGASAAQGLPSVLGHNAGYHSGGLVYGADHVQSSYGQSQAQPSRPPIHPHSTSSAYNAENQLAGEEEREPVSPLHRASMSIDLSSRQSVSGFPSRSESVMSRKSAALHAENSVDQAKPPSRQTGVSPMPGAFIFSSFGGPGDWEHYGEGPDEIDDTAMYGVKHDDDIKLRPAVGVELPAAMPSPVGTPGRIAVPPERPLSESEAGVKAEPKIPVQPPVSELSAPSPQRSVVAGNAGMVSQPPTAVSAPTKSVQLSTTALTMNDGGIVSSAQTHTEVEQLTTSGVLPKASHAELLEQLQAEVEQYRVQVEQLQTSITEYQKQTDLQAQRAATEAEASQRSLSELSKSKDELGQANASLSARQRELESTTSRVQQLERELSGIRNELQTTKEQFESEKASLQKSISDSQVSLAHAHKVHDSDRQQSQGKIVELEASIAAASAASAAAAMEHEKARKQSEEQTNEIEQLKMQLEQSSAQVNETKRLLEEQKNKPADPLGGLDPWFRGSLERFKAVLVVEATAPTVQEKLKAFMDFVNNESRLRGVNMPFTAAGEPVGFQQEAAEPKQGPAQKESTADLSGKAQRPIVNPVSDFVVMEHDGQYSPGGRPIMKRMSVSQPKDPQTAQPPAISSASVDATAGATADDTSSMSTKGQYRPYREGSLPSISDQAAPSPALNAETQKPAYQPFVYRPAAAVVAAAAASSQTMTAERLQTPVSNRKTASAPTVPTLATVQGPNIELFTEPFADKNARTQNQPVIKDDTMLPHPLKPKTPAPLKADAAVQVQKQMQPPLEGLASILPALKMPHPTASSRISAIQHDLSQFTSDYTYISTLTKDWEKRASATRNRLAAERRSREEANEQRNNELFESDEIGYGDIKELEDQQKAEELERQAKEEQDEYASYAKDVFDAAYRQLQEQIGGLLSIYADAEDAMKTGLAGRRALDLGEGDNEAELGEAMGLLLRVHAAVEERYKEIMRCVAERDRRFKRTQTNPLYRRGEIAEMKRMEKGFETNERRSAVKAAVEHVERCKRLWKDINEEVLRGVGENRSYIDSVLAAVDAVAGDNTLSEEPQREKEKETLLLRAQDAIAAVAGNSKRLMQHFDVIDADLNDCEYDVSVTSAKLDGRDQEFLVKLQGQKAAEDKKLKQESLERLKDIDEDLKEAQAVVDRALGGDGRSKARRATIQGGSEEDEEEKQKRLQAALEKAKLRNGDAT